MENILFKDVGSVFKPLTNAVEDFSKTVSSLPQQAVEYVGNVIVHDPMTAHIKTHLAAAGMKQIAVEPAGGHAESVDYYDPVTDSRHSFVVEADPKAPGLHTGEHVATVATGLTNMFFETEFKIILGTGMIVSAVTDAAQGKPVGWSSMRHAALSIAEGAALATLDVLSGGATRFLRVGNNIRKVGQGGYELVRAAADGESPLRVLDEQLDAAIELNRVKAGIPTDYELPILD